jgi:hypothetical protein
MYLRTYTSGHLRLALVVDAVVVPPKSANLVKTAAEA